MKRQIRIGPIQERMSCEVLADILRKVCSFSKIEKVPCYRVVILTFASEAEAAEAIEKLQGLCIHGRKMTIDLVHSVAQKLDFGESGLKKAN